jgi:hypothetical protein
MLQLSPIVDGQWKEWDDVLRKDLTSQAKREHWSQSKRLLAVTRENECLRHIAYNLRDHLWIFNKNLRFVEDDARRRVASADARATTATAVLSRLKQTALVLMHSLLSLPSDFGAVRHTACACFVRSTSRPCRPATNNAQLACRAGVRSASGKAH